MADAEALPAIGPTVTVRAAPAPASDHTPAIVDVKPGRAGGSSDTIVVAAVSVPEGAEAARPPVSHQVAAGATGDGAGPRPAATTFGASAASRASGRLTAVSTGAQAMPVVAGVLDMSRAGAGVSTDTVAGSLPSASSIAAVALAPVADRAAAAAPPLPRQPGPVATTGPVGAPVSNGSASTVAHTVPAPAAPTAASGRADSVVPAAPPVIPLPLPATPRPAVIVFGAALATAFADRRAQAEARPSSDDPLLAGLMSASVHVPSAAVSAMPGAAPLDMRRDDWPQAMLDRIEALRDAADANDTRIRLLPDALGKVDVSLRHDGDTVHVHFAAELPATQTLLNNAQPRLAELAQTRGLRISHNAVDAGGAGAGQHQRGTLPQPSPSIRPASAATTVVDTGADSRLA